MSNVGLRLDQAPPFSVPLRFFLTAPLFGAAAAVVVLLTGPSLFASRWNTALLAVTHLLTLGFLTMVMIGALMQLLPVLAGVPLRHPRAIAAAVHVPLVLGAALLALSFAVPAVPLRYAALGALGAGLVVFLAAAGASLARARLNPSVMAMRLALIGLAVAVLLGLLMASDWARSFFGLSPIVTDTHLAWGLIGWAALLVIGVAYQVVPMFQLTRAYPQRLRDLLVPVVFTVLLLWSLATWVPLPRWFTQASAAAVAAGLAAFAAATLWLQTTRKRRLPDATVRFWSLSMASLLGSIALWAAQATGVTADARLALLAGAWMIVGFAGSVIQGMLYKIVPFLAWLHLQARGPGCLPPNMKEFLPDARTLPHAWLHAAAVALVVPAVLAPMPWLYPAAAVLAASFLWLGWNLLSAALLYRRVLHAPPAARN